MSIELGRRLIAAGAVHPSEIEAAFFRQLVAPMPFVRALLELGHVTEDVLEQELANSMVPFLATIVPLPAIVEELPNQMCRRLMAVPVRRDPRTGLVDVAAVDPFDSNIPYEFSYHLKSEVRILRGSLASIEQALVRIDRGEYTASVILRKSVRPPGYATPSAPPLRSDRPIPLVRRSSRRQGVEVRPVREVAGPEARRGETAPPNVPPAPSVPTFGGGRPSPSPFPRSRQRTAPGPPGVPERHEAPPVRHEPPPVPPGYRGRPEVTVSVPTRQRTETPSGSPSSARGRPETPSAAPPTAKSRPEVPSGSPPSARRPETPSAAAPSAKSRPEASAAAVPVEAKAKPRPEISAGPPPPPAVIPIPASARGGVKARTEAAAPPPATPAPAASSAASSKRAAPAAATGGARGASQPPARTAQGSKARTSSPPSTTRGPFSPKAPVAPFADIRGVLAAMESATTRDDVIDCLIVGMSTVARRVGVFAVKKAHFRGVACNAELGDAARFRAIEISSEATTVLGIAATSDSYLGPLPVTKPHEDLLAFMKNASSEVSATLIRVAGRPAVILFADGLGDSMIATRRAEELGHEASLAFSRILTDAKATKGRS